MTFAEQADIAAKVKKVIESCTRRKHLPAMDRYVEHADKRLNFNSAIARDIRIAQSTRHIEIMRKPRYRLVDGEWIKQHAQNHDPALERWAKSLEPAGLARVYTF